MSRTHTGRVTYANNLPAEGVEVRVLEDVGPGLEELTVERGHSDRTGTFKVRYNADAIDLKPPILVFSYTYAGQLETHTAPLSQTKSYKLPETLPLRFVPSQHGLHFVNNFPPYKLPRSLPKIPGLPIVSTNYGLCGGMSCTAYDYFLAGRDVPADTKPPAQGTPLHKYLFQRAMNTFGLLGENILQIGLWTQAPEETAQGTYRRTYEAFEGVRRSLDSQRAVVLCLIYEAAATIPEMVQRIWNNHQVLAHAYSPRLAGSIDLHIYDPNFPDNDQVIIRAERVVIPTDDGPLHGFKCTQIVPGRMQKTVRGFFPMNYRPETPPKP